MNYCWGIMLDNIMFVILTYKAVSVDSPRWVILYMFSEERMLPIIKNSYGNGRVHSKLTNSHIDVISDHGFVILAT